jgi:hypothetical protein
VYRALAERVPDLTFPDGIYGCSVGCIPALALAYRLSSTQAEEICCKHLSANSIVDKITLDDVRTLLDKRGLITLDRLTNSIAVAFDEYGIDLRTKTMDDLPQKVYFVASNMTTGRASLLTGKIPVLKALACSSCLPFLCCPEILNGHVYLDGAVFARTLRTIVPRETLIVDLARGNAAITPSSGSLLDILISMIRGVKFQYCGSNILRIENDTVGILDDMTIEQKRAATEEGYSQARAFFAKRLTQELK